MANLNQPNSSPSSVLVPRNYPKEPSPGKISLLFSANEKQIYHKLNFDIPMYRYPDNPPSGLRKVGGRGLPLGLGVDDVIRVTRFIGSGKGLLFVGKQFMLQGFQPFDETNLYNPTEIILSATANLTGGLLTSPKRHIDKSGGLLGGLASLVGIGISRGNPPPSTVAAGGNGSGGKFLEGLFTNLVGSSSSREEEVLPVQNYGNATGLLRGKTASKAKSILQSKWGVASGGSTGGILGFIKGMAKSMFPQAFGSIKQNGVKQRSDELTYDWMVKFYNDVTANNLAQGSKANGLGISFMGIPLKNLGSKKLSTQMTNAVVQQFKLKYYFSTENGSKTYSKDGAYSNGTEEKSEALDKFNFSIHIDDSDLLQKQKNTYFDVRNWTPVDGKSPIEKAFDLYKKEGKSVTSRELVEDSSFVDQYGEKTPFSVGFDNTIAKQANNRSVSQNTKLNDSSKSDNPASQINDNLKKVISNINRSGIYKVGHTNVDTWLLSSGNPTKRGYDRLLEISKTPFNMKNNKNSVESAYYDNGVRTLDSIINPVRNVGLAGSGRSDKINTLTVLDKDKLVKEKLLSNYTEWNPYEDDVIAFFFYDVVNEKYIPFRSTVKGLSESANAFWDEMKFVGRADSLYSYSGFVRNLSFSFTVVINSLIELAPTWQRINYLVSSVKPSNYTKKLQNDGVTNRFMVPPMFMLTIGDLYKYQPVIITSVTVTIPDNATWELVPENSTNPWSYLSNIITTTVPQEKIGQMPKEAEISVACNILEKERPIIGGNHFGHAVQRELFGSKANHLPVEHLQNPSEFSKNLRTVSITEADD
jgi:hypothetical protein